MINLFKKLKRAIKFSKQREKRGFDDSILWDLFTDLAEYIYPRVKAFRDMERVGYPNYFSEFNENNESKEDYAKAVEEGHRSFEVAHGLLTPEQAWKNVLNKIVYAFEYAVFVEGGKSFEEQRPFWKHYFGFSPWNEDYECNRYDRWAYTAKETGYHVWTFKDPQREDAVHSIHYGNTQLMSYAHECAQIGLNYFAQYFFALWD
jgi:hypothetical protein